MNFEHNPRPEGSTLLVRAENKCSNIRIKLNNVTCKLHFVTTGYPVNTEESPWPNTSGALLKSSKCDWVNVSKQNNYEILFISFTLNNN